MKLSGVAILSCLSLFWRAGGFTLLSSTSSRGGFVASTAQPIEALDETNENSELATARDDLILRAKQILGPEIALGTKDGGECLADNFEFCAAVVGPLPKEEYLGALGNFRLEDSFDIAQNFFGFHVDPMQTNRVWFMSRQSAKHVNTFQKVEPTGKELVLPPQIFHLDFDEEGKVKEVGFYTADRRQGNTGGLGGAFGVRILFVFGGECCCN
jgi:hypothetical protein